MEKKTSVPGEVEGQPLEESTWEDRSEKSTKELSGIPSEPPRIRVVGRPYSDVFLTYLDRYLVLPTSFAALSIVLAVTVT